MTNEGGKSDRPVVPKKSPNKVEAPAAEAVEERGRAKGNPRQQGAPRTQSRPSAPSALERIRRAARQDGKRRFTALLHHAYDVERLRAAFQALKRDAAAGVDGVTWKAYRKEHEANLQDLSGRLQRGAYRAKPTRRTYIDKADGRRRPLGVPSLEDKIVQRAAGQVLGAVYEEDFLGFSHGFRPGRSPHQALDALAVGIMRRKVNWVLDADIREFFDTLDHGWLVAFLEHRVADRRVVHLIQKWLKAGVLEDGKRTRSEAGTVQGGSISPLLANVYLHYVFDLWIQQWRRKQARGDVIVVRFADDFVVGFEHRHEAERFLAELRERFARFGLALHADKTRLIEFGRLAAPSRKRRGNGKPETFDFLGFTHICGKTRGEKFTVIRQTMRTRLQAKLKAVKAELRQRRHDTIPEQGAYLRAVVGGQPVLWRTYEQPRHRCVPAGSGADGATVSGGAARNIGAVGAHGALRQPLAATPIRYSGSALLPEAGAGCGSAARPDLWRGAAATRLPTPTAKASAPSQAQDFILRFGKRVNPTQVAEMQSTTPAVVRKRSISRVQKGARCSSCQGYR